MAHRIEQLQNSKFTLDNNSVIERKKKKREKRERGSNVHKYMHRYFSTISPPKQHNIFNKTFKHRIWLNAISSLTTPINPSIVTFTELHLWYDMILCCFNGYMTVYTMFTMWIPQFFVSKSLTESAIHIIHRNNWNDCVVFSS